MSIEKDLDKYRMDIQGFREIQCAQPTIMGNTVSTDKTPGWLNWDIYDPISLSML